MLLTREMPYCCTAQVVVNFGETTTTDGTSATPSEIELREELRNIIGSAEDSGLALLVATTNRDQTVANKVLEELGFESSPFIRKDKHYNTQVKLWYYIVGKEVE